MPGAPNRPPETAAPAPAPAPVDPALRAVRRLVPSRIALPLDLWKGAPSSELLDPLEKAERLLAAGDAAGALGALDQLSIRFHEPRWPSLPKPFRDLRVAIPFPQPPQWDPENALPPAEKEARRQRRDAELQGDLVEASVAFAQRRGIAVDDLTAGVAAAKTALASPGVPPEFWTAVDAIWAALRERVPAPRAAARAPARPAGAPAPEPT